MLGFVEDPIGIKTEETHLGQDSIFSSICRGHIGKLWTTNGMVRVVVLIDILTDALGLESSTDPALFKPCWGAEELNWSRFI